MFTHKKKGQFLMNRRGSKKHRTAAGEKKKKMEILGRTDACATRGKDVIDSLATRKDRGILGKIRATKKS